MKLFIMTLAVLASVTLSLVNFRPSYADFDQNRLIDDAIFNNTGTMSAASIDSWLNQFPNSCISPNHGFSAPDVTGYSPTGPVATGGFSYGSDVTAGTIIYHASQVYGINPQVILTTLEKEEGLDDGSGTADNPACSNLRYTAAMGYLCTDTVTPHDYSGFELYSLNGTPVTSVSGTCTESVHVAGFSRQVIVAAWQLKFDQQRSEGNMGFNVQRTNYPYSGDTWDNSDDPQTCYTHKMTEGYYQTCPSGSFAQYDGLYSIDGTTVHMDNGSTAALYNYTPHFPGNQHFVSLFTGWFGSTTNICGNDPGNYPNTSSRSTGDFNGDGKTDISIYRPTDSCWHIRAYGDVLFGQSGDIPVPGDYNGDGKTDIAVFRPSTGDWHIRGVGDYLGYGQSGDIPVPGDYNGDKKTEAAVYRPSQCPGGECYWHIRGVGDFQYGHPGDIPVPGDYNGDGKTDIAVFRPSDGMWHVRAVGDFSYGQSGDIPVPGDYNGDKKTEAAVYRPSQCPGGECYWHIRGVGDFQYGQASDVPAPGDYNGDGKTEIAVFRPTDGMWHLSVVGDYQYGQSGDIPTANNTLNAYLLQSFGLISSF